ncbi:MAG: Hsp20/alpha crystallin family protein [Bacteroidetes bacterium]|nr:Hsp20/alpha crystallin family protein [Bacteroidota bacterium]MBI3482215.1 Hsp20/alpha crystallin family protein [Bacteroidota bacterium]
MSIIRYNPNDFVPSTFSSLVDRFFNESMVKNGGSTFSPKVDVIENESSYEVHLAVPGVNKEDFKVEVNDNFLTVSGERKFTNEKKEKNYHSVETQYGSFSRSFTLPENVDGTKINAKYNNGILELVIPKDEKKILKQTIKVS